LKIDQNRADRDRSRFAIGRTAMKFRIGRLLAIAAFVCCGLASARTLAQNTYVTNFLSNNVSVIAAASNTVTTTIPVGLAPHGVAVSPDGSKVYVANSDSDTVSVISAATDRVTATIPVGSGPLGVAVSPTQIIGQRDR
jgi:YVTN family beta-propeller protein